MNKAKNVLFFEKNCRSKVWLFFTKNFGKTACFANLNPEIAEFTF
jgi:hypothetical protein